MAAPALAGNDLPVTVTPTGSSISGNFAIGGLITGHMPDVKKLFVVIWLLMSTNPYLALMVAFGLLPVGIFIFRRIKRTARR